MPPRMRESAASFGRDYGIAFQLANDVRDAFGSEGLAGKDMMQGKMNNIVFLNGNPEFGTRDAIANDWELSVGLAFLFGAYD